MMTHDEISRFFSEEAVKKAFQLPDWPAGTEVVCYCRSTDSRYAIEKIAWQKSWKILRYIYIDDMPIAALFKEPGQVIFTKRNVIAHNMKTDMLSYNKWCEQLLGGLHPSDWDNS